MQYFNRDFLIFTHEIIFPGTTLGWSLVLELEGSNLQVDQDHSCQYVGLAFSSIYLQVNICNWDFSVGDPVDIQFFPHILLKSDWFPR